MIPTPPTKDGIPQIPEEPRPLTISERQPPYYSDLREELEKLSKRVEELEKRVQELEGKVMKDEG